VVLYVTERCVFELTPQGLALVEVAPGVDVERDVVARMGFEPIVRGTPRTMDARLFAPALMEIKDELLAVPLEARFSYDPDSNRFFLNLEGMAVRTPAEVRALHAEIDERMARIGKKVDVVVNYDNFHLAPDVVDDYTAALQDLADRYYAGVTRYTTSSFLRLKLGAMLTERRVAPHIHESREEAMGFLGRPDGAGA
jgi:propionate CoA-transferase